MKRFHFFKIHVLLVALALMGTPERQLACSCSCCNHNHATPAGTNTNACCHGQEPSGGDQSAPCPGGCPCTQLVKAPCCLASFCLDSDQNNNILKVTSVRRNLDSHEPPSNAHLHACEPLPSLTPCQHCASLCRFLL